MNAKQKPASAMTEEEFVAYLQKKFAAEDYFTGVLGNRNSFFIAKPTRRRKPATRKLVKVTA